MQRLLRLLIVLWCLLSVQAYVQGQPIVQGDAVITCGAMAPGDPVVAVIKAQTAGLQPLNTNWFAPANHPADWNRSQLGQVFGIALDARGNIYVTTTVAYPIDVFGPGGSGAVYRIDAVTNDVTIFATLPNSGGVGLGNICWDPDHNPPGSTNGQFFVTNFEDGRIYRLNGTTGALAGPPFDPFGIDPGISAPGFAPRNERLWGVAYRRAPAAPGVARVYFARWREDLGNPSTLANNEIHSVALDVSGSFVPGSVLLEAVHPGFPPATSFPTGNWSNPAADIEFSQDGRRMLVAERGWLSDNNAFQHTNTAHCARLIEFVNPGTGWALSTNIFSIGQITVGGIQANSAGGTDYGYRTFNDTTKVPGECDSVVWSSGNALHFNTGDRIYGEQMLPATGGGIANSVLIDLDGDLSSFIMKNYVGDIDIFRNCALLPPRCDRTSLQLNGAPNPTGACCWNLNITNSYLPNFWTAIYLTMLTPGATFTSSTAPGGWTAGSTTTSILYTPNVGSIPLGASGPLQFCIDPDTTTSQDIIVTWVANNGLTCVDTITATCNGGHPCGELVGIKLACLTSAPTTPTYSMTFSVTNSSSTTFTNATVTSNTMGTNVLTPTISFPTLPPMTTSTPKTITLSGGASGTVVCLTIKLWNSLKQDWCSFDTCIVLPRCPDCCDSLNLKVTPVGSTSSSISGLVSINQLLTSAPHPLSKFTATIVSATKATWCKLGPGTSPEAPVVATFTFGSIGGNPPSTPYGTGELTWGTYYTGVLLNNTPNILRLKFPPITGLKCVDTLRFCIKYTFTDTACLTCDTTICYKVIRRGSIFFLDDVHENSKLPFGTEEKDGGDDPGKTEDDDRSLLSFGSSGKPISITMASETGGTLTIQNLIEADDDPNLSMTIVGVALEPEVGIDLTQMSDNTGIQLAVITDRVATINPLVAPITPGETRNFSLMYDNAGSATSFTNYLKVYYTVPEYGQEILEATVALYARTPLGFGGDILAEDKDVELENVRTYALRFENKNSTSDQIARVEITVAEGKGDGDDIVAVGPGIDQTRVDLKAYETLERKPRVLLLVEEPSEEDAEAKPMEPGTVVTPIYITVRGGLDNQVEFDYTTFNENNEVISTGTVVTNTPLLPGPADVDNPTIPGVSISAVECIPNPVNETATFSFTLPRAEASVWLVITDMRGTEVARVINGDAMPAGPHEVLFDMSKLPSGTYLYTLRTKEQVQTRQVQIVR